MRYSLSGRDYIIIIIIMRVTSDKLQRQNKNIVLVTWGATRRIAIIIEGI